MAMCPVAPTFPMNRDSSGRHFDAQGAIVFAAVRVYIKLVWVSRPGLMVSNPLRLI
jgi:hypothetical protein